jgi:3-(3-hydroxy-phenyl)propionate hydroxylase
MVNSGRLSTASAYATPLSTPDTENWVGGVAPGGAMRDAQLRRNTGETTFLTDIVAPRFTLLHAGKSQAAPPDELRSLDVDLIVVALASEDGTLLRDADRQFAQRYNATEGTAYLLRPDGHVAARFRQFSVARLESALARAQGRAAP